MIVIFIPSLLYSLKFWKFNLSDNPADWGTFGDYIGGVIGTCFSLLATVLALVSIYISLKISEKVQENEIKFNEENAKRDSEKFEREVTLLHKQFKPFPYPEFKKYDEVTSISIENHGAGPMIVSNIKITYQNKLYANFRELLIEQRPSKLEELCFKYNTAPSHSLVPGSSKELLKLYPKTELSDDFRSEQYKIRNLLKDCTLSFEFEDIFETKKSFSVNLAFFKQ